MQSKKIEVRCECPSESKETTGSLMSKINAGARELQRLLDTDPSTFLAQSLFHTNPCSGCNGKGVVNVANGQDDFDTVECGGCNGTGRVVANN